MSYISASLRLLVAHRSLFRCEYCRIPDLGFGIPFQVDHIRAIKHGGLTVLSNLAYCCPDCNRYKGSDLGSYLEDETIIIRFYNPRTDYWDDHFTTVDGIIKGKTPHGEVTTTIFQFNSFERIMYRNELIANELY
jgi:hypothetical protein